MNEKYFLPPPPKYRFTDLLKYIYNAYTFNPFISIPLFIRDSINSINSIVFFVIIIYLLSLTSYPTPENLLRLFRKNGNLVIILILISLLIYVSIYSLASSYYWCMLIPVSIKIFREEDSSTSDMLDGIKNVRKIFRAIFTVNLVIALIPASILLFLLKYLLNFANISSILFLITLSIIAFIIYLILNFFSIYVPYIAYFYNLNPFKCISESIRLVVKTFLDLIVYIVIRITAISIIGIVVFLFELISISISNMIAFIFSAIIIPIIDIALFGIFYQQISYIVPFRRKKSLKAIFSKYFKKGLIELKKFVIDLNSYPYILLSILILILSIYLGLWIANTYLHSIIGYIIKKGRINPIFSKYFPFSIATEIFFNNWKVSITSSVGGIATPIPPIAIEMLNGIILGIIFSNISIKEFTVLVMPHGIIELPCFLISIAMGIRLGIIFFLNRERLSNELRRAVLLSIGLSPLFFIAALVEAYITPFLARNILGWS